MYNRTNQQRTSSSVINRSAYAKNVNSNSPVNNSLKSKHHQSCYLNVGTPPGKTNKSGVFTVELLQNSDSRMNQPSNPLPLTQRERNELSSKFKNLSSSVMKLATSKKPVGVKSLESLLTQEIAKTIGSAVLDPRCSQMFTEATRDLLDNLVYEFEEGRISPRLKSTGKLTQDGERTFIKADSSSTICYRDRYFKELVMNILQSMSSNEIEKGESEESLQTNPTTVESVDLHGPLSRERLNAIRNIVRTEAGIENAMYQGLQDELNELQESLVEKKKELLRSTRDLEKIISHHLTAHDFSTSDYVRIPGSARLMLKSCCVKKQTCLSGGCETMTSDSEGDSKSSCTIVTKCKSKISLNKAIKSKESIGVFDLDKDKSGEENSHKFNENIVQDVVLNTNNENNVNKYNGFDGDKLLDQPKGDEVSIINDLESFDEEDDEINEEESLIFLQALKANIEHKKTKNTEHGNWKVKYNILKDNVSKLSLPESFTSSSSTVSLCLKPNKIEHVSLNIEPDCMRISSKVKEQVSNENTMRRTPSQWWSTDDSIANEIVREMKRAFDKIKVMSSEIINNILISDESKDELQEIENLLEGSQKTQPLLINNDFNCTVNEMIDICFKVSNKIDQLPEHLQEADTNEQKEQLLIVSKILESSLNGLSSSHSNCIIHFNDEEQLPLSIKNISTTFSFLSKLLRNSPSPLKSQPVSVLSPPKSLTQTLAFLASTEYFKDCFTSVIETNRVSKFDSNKEIQIVKPFNVTEQVSSNEINTLVPENYNLTEVDTFINTSNFSQNATKLKEIDKHLTYFEHFLGLTPNVMTVQNLSDMLLFLSAVLDDVPVKYKGETILSLDPPTTIMKALNILYTTVDGVFFNETEKRKSFASLTVQNASDFFLTLSTAFEDAPPRVKNSTIVDLNPPQSLLKAVTMLTSLSHNSQLVSESQEEVEVRTKHEMGCRSESQDNFFDARDSMTFLKCV